MNHIFSFNRFENYFKRDLLLNKSRYLYLIGTFLGMYALALLIYIAIGLSIASFIIMGLTVVIAIAPCIFEPNITKYNGVMDYTYPVSSLERFLMLWLRYVILFPLFTFGVYYLISTILGNLHVNELTAFSNIFLDKMGLGYKKIYAILGFQSVYLLGYLSFPKNSFWKTILVQLVLFIGFLIIGLIVGNTLYSTASSLPRHQIGEYILGLDYEYIPFIFKVVKYFSLFLFPFGMWIVSFFRIREKEI